jgi:hypothetical protein
MESKYTLDSGTDIDIFNPGDAEHPAVAATPVVAIPER